MPHSDEETSYNLETLQNSAGVGSKDAAFGATILSLGIIWHPDPARIGAIAPVQFASDNTFPVSRLSPIFQNPENGHASPLLDQRLSRTPFLIERTSSRQFKITPPAKRVSIFVNGRALTKPSIFEMDEFGEEIILTLSNAVTLSLYNAPARLLNEKTVEDCGLVGISNGMALVRNAIASVAKSEISVLIRGETGTGKELVARAIHAQSDRTNMEMTTVNMAAFAPTLAAAELFGVKKGAFTGADQDKAGLFELADGSVLFLDEVGDTPSEIQPMLLRALELGEVRRVGSTKSRYVDVRIIAATDRSLEYKDGEPSFNQPFAATSRWVFDCNSAAKAPTD